MTRLDIISDPVCPWCYIGASNLTRTLAARQSHPFAINWRPFQLNPDMPPEGMDRTEYLEAKFGGPEGAARIYGSIENAAREAGLDVDFAAITRAPNTLDCHRVMRWAGPEGVQTKLAGGLFHRYFKLGEDISDHGVLRAAAEDAGMDGAAIARLLAGDADRAEVQAEASEARDMGVTGVPAFILGGKYALNGAQPVETWNKVIDELAAST
jgi:predicted DsbA family dithiol-disulfide isomerase